MQKRLIPAFILVAYSAILVKVMVFKDVPLVRVGRVMLNFGGTNEGHSANFVPFKTILPYLFGYKGLIIAGINLVGNIVFLVPLGFIAPFVYRNMTWKKSLVLGVAAGLVIEVMQVLLRVGIFDIDDVILNALGFMIGYWAFAILAKMTRSMKPRNVIIAATIVIVVAASATLYGFQKLQLSFEPGVVSDQADRLGDEQEAEDLCGGTGGNGEIVSLENGTIVMKRNDGGNQIINLTDQATIETSAGPASAADLKVGDRVTLVGGPNPDGSFTAEAVFVCAVTGS